MNREAIPDAEVVHERASASILEHRRPDGSSSNAELAGAYGAPSRWALPLTLRAQQEWFCAVVTTPLNEQAPLTVEAATQLVSAGPQLSALERLDIYRRGYHARLLECLTDDYPAVAFALGETTFDELCHGYMAAHPSASPSLNSFGQHLATFCAAQALPMAEFISDLAALEWAIVGAIHAPTARTLVQGDLTNVAPESWADVKLIANPSLRILRTGFPVNDYYHAFRRNLAPELPAAAPGIVAVYRTGASVWRLPLSTPMALLVESLAAGLGLGASLERVAPTLTGDSESQAAGRISAWFREAVSSGLFSEIRLDSAPG
jgi:hypothetical protein